MNHWNGMGAVPYAPHLLDSVGNDLRVIPSRIGTESDPCKHPTHSDRDGARSLQRRTGFPSQFIPHVMRDGNDINGSSQRSIPTGFVFVGNGLTRRLSGGLCPVPHRIGTVADPYKIRIFASARRPSLQDL